MTSSKARGLYLINGGGFQFERGSPAVVTQCCDYPGVAYCKCVSSIYFQALTVKL